LSMGAPDQFTPLRKLAREKRDRTIADARAEYASTMTALATIEGRLSEKRPRQGYMTASICAALPRDTEFTGPDLLAALEAADDGRPWTKKGVTNLIGKLRRRGLIRRTRRPTPNKPAVYVRIDAHSGPADFKDAPLPEVIRSVLSEPMSVAEIARAALEAGYRTTQSAAGLRQSVRAELREGPYRRLARGK
jgi:hypothetical protein